MTASTEQSMAGAPSGSSLGASPIVAAMMAGGTAYAWAEAIIRYLATNTPVGGWYMLYAARDGDIVAMWLTAIVAGLAVFTLAYLVFRKKSSVGSLRMWTIILAVSLILAPLIGEIGTPIGI